MAVVHLSFLVIYQQKMESKMLKSAQTIWYLLIDARSEATYGTTRLTGIN